MQMFSHSIYQEMHTNIKIINISKFKQSLNS